MNEALVDAAIEIFWRHKEKRDAATTDFEMAMLIIKELCEIEEESEENELRLLFKKQPGALLTRAIAGWLIDLSEELKEPGFDNYVEQMKNLKKMRKTIENDNCLEAAEDRWIRAETGIMERLKEDYFAPQDKPVEDYRWKPDEAEDRS